MSCLFLKTYVRVCNKIKQKRNERINKCVKSVRWRRKRKKPTYWRKVHGYTSRSSPPLWYPFFACQPTHWSSLIRHPINGDVCVRFSLIETCCHDTSGKSIVVGVLNPWHCRIVYIRLVTGVDVIDSDLNFNWFVRIEYVRLQMDHYTVRISQCWNVRHVLATMLEWKNWKKK